MNESVLFSKLRASIFHPAPFNGKITQVQVDGIHAILSACEELEVTAISDIASALTPPMIETGGSYELIEENLHYRADRLRDVFPKYFKTASITAQYAMRPEAIANRAYANRIGNGPESSGDGWKFRGRGFPQLTGRSNYATMAKLLNLPLIEKPELALDLKTSAKILVIGMRDGLFTGKTLSRYRTKVGYDFKGARDIINPGDRNADNERFGKQIYAALAASV